MVCIAEYLTRSKHIQIVEKKLYLCRVIIKHEHDET